MPTTHIRGQLSVRHSSIPLMLLLATTAMPAFAQTEPATPSQDAAVSDTADQAGGSTAADTNAAPAQQNGLENIVVTATKRETNLQKTPIAISVANTQTLTDRHAQSLLDLGDGSIPSLRVATFEARKSALTVGIRGIVPFDANQTARDQGVGVYVDGVYLGRQQGLNASLLDIDRIEVLRGPQGTLFGRNTEGGAVSIITKAPTGELEIRGTAGVGNYGQYDGILHVDLPAFYNIALKFDGFVQHQDETVKNPLDGEYGWNYEHAVGGRAQARWTPTSNLTVDLSYDYVKDENTPNYSQLINFNPNGYDVGTFNASGALVCPNVGVPCIRPLAPVVDVSGGDRMKTADVGVPQQLSTDVTHGFTGTIKYKVLDNLELRSITAWRGVEVHQWDNSGGAHRSTYTPFIPGVTTGNAGLFSRYSLSELFQHQFSQEVQAVGSFTNVDYVIGGYYFNEDAEEAAATPFTNRFNADGTGYTIVSENGDGVPQPDTPPLRCGNTSIPSTPNPISIPQQGWDRDFWCTQRHSTADAESLGFFGQATWTPIDPLHITVGARWTKEKRDGILDIVNGKSTAYTFKFKDDRIDPMVTLAWDATQDIHLYAKYSTGYRAGGANDRSATFRSFGPETVKAYEIGGKMDFWDHRGRLNLAGYIMPRKGTQTDFDYVNTDNTSPTFGTHTEETINAPGKTKIHGVEADLTLRPIEALTFGASYAYTYTKVPETENPLIPGNPLTQVFIVYTPKHAASGFVDYELPSGIGNGNWRFHLDANYASKQHSFQGEDVWTDPSFIVNGRVALADVEMNEGSTLVTFALWSRNLLNETHIYRRSAANSVPAANFTNGAPNGTFTYTGVLGDYGNFNPPRTWGAEVSFKVGKPHRQAMEYVAPPPPPPATVTCESGAVVVAPGSCPPPPAPPAPPPPPAPEPERG